MDSTTMDLGDVFSGNHVHEENVVSYTLHDCSDGVISLEALRGKCLARLAPYTVGYIWQRKAFVLNCSDEVAPPWSGQEEDCNVPHLWGCTKFGDSVDDEWLIVGLLQHLTSCIPSLAVKVWDNDGEFLLIECAKHIPSWLKPENSSNRVWLRQGKIHLISNNELESSITTQAALDEFQKAETDTEAGSRMQEALLQRTKGYPDQASRNLHCARCRVPVKVAQIIKNAPQLVSEAAHCFVHRTHEDMKVAAKMEKFQSEDFTVAMICMHRCSYAQLVQQHFQPPKGYPMPSSQDPGYKGASLGVKLLAGFEILYQKSNCAGGNPIEDKVAPEHRPAWAPFLTSLKENGYFKDNIPGSTGYCELFSAALAAFQLTSTHKNGKEGRPTAAARMDSVLKDTRVCEEWIAPEIFAEDDDSWLYQGLDKMDDDLERWDEADVGLQEPSNSDMFDPEDLADGMKAFVQKLASHEGAEIPTENYGDVSFDSERFVSELQSALGFLNHTGRGAAIPNEGSELCSSGSDDLNELSWAVNPPEHEQLYEIATATDSDDDSKSSADFAEAYDEAMSNELQGTKVKATTEMASEATDGDAVEPMNIDVQVVKNLLKSYSSENGIPGPVGNLLGMMDVRVPRIRDDEHSKKHL